MFLTFSLLCMYYKKWISDWPKFLPVASRGTAARKSPWTVSQHVLCELLHRNEWASILEAAVVPQNVCFGCKFNYFKDWTVCITSDDGIYPWANLTISLAKWQAVLRQWLCCLCLSKQAKVWTLSFFLPFFVCAGITSPHHPPPLRIRTLHQKTQMVSYKLKIELLKQNICAWLCLACEGNTVLE